MVDQLDRDAAAEMWTVMGKVSFADWQPDWMRDGTADRGPVVQAFAAHRIAAEARAMEWKEQHENLLAVRQQDIAALQSKIEGLEAQLKFKNEAISLTKGCRGKVVVRDGFYVLDCYKKKHSRAALNGGQHE